MNFKRYIDRNQKLILYIIAIVIFILFIIHGLNTFYEEKEKEKIENISKNSTNQTNTTSQTIITKEEANEIKNDSVDGTMKLFVYYCNNGEISKAYSMLTDDCKNAMFKTEEQFKDIYVKSIFNGTRDYTMIKWATDANKTVCQVQFFADMLATGGGEGNKTQEYYTFIKNNDGSYKMNINNFIYASVEDINNEQNNIKVKITKVEVYDSYEEYTISITNNREKEICLTGNKYNKNLYLKGENGATYSSFNSDFDKETMTIEPGITKNYKIKFNKIYSSSNLTVKMIFSDVILDYKDYMQSTNKDEYTNRTSLEIKC